MAAVTPRTKLVALSQVLWTTGQVLPVRELRETTGRPDPRRRRPVRRRDPGRGGRARLSHISGQKWLCGPDPTGGLVVADPERLRRASLVTSRGRRTSQTGASRPGPARGASSRAGSPRLRSRGSWPRSRWRPSWRFERASEHGRAVPFAPRRRRRGRRSRRTSARRSSPGVTRGRGRCGGTARGAGVVVRELPGTGLVRASVGWWTSEDDLDRLVAAL